MPKVIKREGIEVEFNKEKIVNAIAKAMLETEHGVTEELYDVAESLEKYIDGMEVDSISVEEIQDIVEGRLMEYGLKDTAKRYIIYRNKRAELRSKGWEMTDLQKSIWENKYRHDGESFEEWLERVSGGNQRIKTRIRKKQFSFGGRILANRGLFNKGYKITYSNCYVLPAPQDNIESIWDTARDMARTYSYGGGVGISLRNLRPRDARVHNNARTTSGAVSFMPLYSLTTETIGQNGRRGALMLSIPSSHPDLEEFIDIKTKQGSVTGANISIEIDDAFMMAVENEEQYRLHFTVQDTGEVIEKFVDAKELYKRIVQNNIDWAEPGKLFWDRITSYHIMSNHPDFEYQGTNPCAEEPLPPGGSCLLGSINLSEFVIAPFTGKARFDFQAYAEAVRDAVVALNEVLDEGLPLHPLQVQRDTVRELRQIGLGIMGDADMNVKLGITYGSTQSLALKEVIAHIQVNEALQTSALYAKDHGTFGWYDWNLIKENNFLLDVATPETWALIEKYGLANSQLLCIAPTGSIATMFGVSGGVEPFFSLSYNRTTKSLHGKDVTYKVEEDIVRQYREATGNQGELPEYFVTAQTLNWRNRIETQAVWQKYIDASISSTVNLPKGTTADEAMDLYMYAWKMGLKGCTIYVADCKRSGILTLDETSEEPVVEEVEEVRATGYYSTCPECQSEQMVVSGGCVVCKDCGFSPC